MKTTTKFALLSTALLLTAAVAWAKTSTDYDHNANFTAYKTYSWGKLETADPLWNQRVKEAVESQLAAKGLTQVPSGGDVVVNAFGKTQAEHTLNTFYDGFGGGGWRWRGFGGMGEATTTTETYQVGTLVVDLLDSNSKGLVWRGIASDTLSSSADKNTKKLESDVKKLFENFPPKAGK